MNDVLEIEGVRIYGQWAGSSLWFMGRATDKDTFDALAVEAALRVFTNPAQAEAIDTTSGVVLRPAIAASGPLIAAPGVTITEIGELVLVEGTYNEAGVELSAPVVDARYHVNFWLGPVVVARGEWMRWVTFWTYYGEQGVANNAEDSTVVRGFELIDPSTTLTASNRLL